MWQQSPPQKKQGDAPDVLSRHPLGSREIIEMKAFYTKSGLYSATIITTRFQSFSAKGCSEEPLLSTVKRLSSMPYF